MKPTLLLLTNFNHGVAEGFEEEDIILADYLRKHFTVVVSHPLDCENVEDMADLILIRNIWPVFEYEKEWNEVKNRLLKKGLTVYGPLTGKGDMFGKDHLVDLFKLGYPVIPTVDRIGDIEKMNVEGDYFIKPKDKCDAVGAERIAKAELMSKKLENHVIQPYVDFEYEVSFYVIDGEIISSFSTPRKVYPYKIKEYRPTKKDIEFVKKFVDWNGLSFGLQRIDACRTKEGDLLLIELEDFCPYLNLLKLSDKKRLKFLKKLVGSLKSSILT